MIACPLFTAAALVLGLLAAAPAMAGSTSHTDVIGRDNKVDSAVSAGGSTDVRIYGNRNEAVLSAKNGSHVGVRMNCNDCHVSVNAQ
jgi:hypothetical protein